MTARLTRILCPLSICALICIWSAAAGCTPTGGGGGNGDGMGPADGDEGGACFPNQTCNAGLTCNASNICEASDGNGNGDGDGNGDDDNQARLWVISPNANLLSFLRPGILDGFDTPPSTELELSINTQVISTKDAVVTPGEVLIIANGAGISIFDNAATASGPRTPDRLVTGPNSEINSPIAVAYDGVSDVLFVIENSGQHTIYVFDNVSQPGFDGDPQPDRLIASDDTLFNPEQMFFFAGDLYVVVRDDIFVFADASTLDTMDALPDRIISGDLLDEPIVSIDSAGRLVVANQGDTLLIWNNASSLDGSPPPDLMLTINGASRLEAAVIDSDDRLYAADRNLNVIYSLDNISQLTSGSLNPDRVIESSDLRTPERLFLFEPPE